MKYFALIVVQFAAALLVREAASQGSPTAPTTQPTNYAITLRNPASCEPASCTIFVGVNLNEGDNNYLDLYLEAEADGYVAIGFSDSQSMFDADVVACARNSSDNMVEARDSWNPSSPTRGNMIDATQDISVFSTEYAAGRIRCSVAKRIIGSDTDPRRDLDLNTPLFILYARLPGDLNNFPNLQNHGQQNRAVSGMRFTLPSSSATSLHSTQLILMLAAVLIALCVMTYY